MQDREVTYLAHFAQFSGFKLNLKKAWLGRIDGQILNKSLLLGQELIGQHIVDPLYLSKLLKLSTFGWESLMDSNIQIWAMIFKQI
jgi:hypothetical protein